MSGLPAASNDPAIRLRGVRQNNLKNFDLDIPAGKLVVVTGLSGSGKSSLAFDTLYAEGQRRYIETFSPYARQFFDRMDKPRVDSIQGIPPAIALEQRNAVKSTRSTIGTMTELTDYMKLLWPHIARLYCRQCGRAVRKDSPQEIWEEINIQWPSAELLVTFALPLSAKLSIQESLGLLAQQGYQRILWPTENDPMNVLRVDEALASLDAAKAESLVVVQDRLRLEPGNRARFIEAAEQAYHFGKGRLSLRRLPDGQPCRFSRALHCAECDLEYREPSPALFSFNNPVGACPACKGFGRVISIDYNLAIPDRSLSIAEGLVKPWQTGTGQESQKDLAKFCKRARIDMLIPFHNLPEEQQKLVIEGEPDYGIDKAHEWPRAWYGIKGYFRWLESKSYKMHVRVQLSKYRCYTPCPECKGQRFKPDALDFKLETGGNRLTLSDFYRLPVRDALALVQGLPRNRSRKTDPFTIALEEVAARLGYLEEVGLGYLTLDRPTRSLSGGETERVNLTTCLGSRLVNTLFVLDEPSVGLHARDTAKLVTILQRLRDAGNTVVVVEHESSVMRAANQIIDLGPGQGERGGHVVFQGTHAQILNSSDSLTGAFLSGRREIAENAGRKVDLAAGPKLRVTRATLHNIRDLEVEIPLGCFVAVTGVSGSGKSTLVRDLIHPALALKLQAAAPAPEDTEEAEKSAPEGGCRVAGWEQLGAVVMVDQSSIGRTPRSNPVVYIDAFEDLRALYALSPAAKKNGLNESFFSFNSRMGQCETCRGAGFEKIEMQFLSDVFIRCSDCQGRRYRPAVLEIAVESTVNSQPVSWSIADLLEATVDDSIEFISNCAEAKRGRFAVEALRTLQEVGLGYLRLGQPINTLSGGESQRLKLVRHLAESARGVKQEKPTLFIFDEPTTGLHFQDVEILLRALQRLVVAGHSVMVVEHNLDVIRAADWVIDLGPDAGDQGGRLVAQGPPPAIAAAPESVTGQFLRR